MGVSLSKGQKISLSKEGGEGLKRISMGLGWDAVKSKGFMGFGGGQKSIDLDASCVLFDDAGNQVDAVWFRQLRSQDGSIVHTGDNRTGAGEGDDESILVDLPQVPANVKSLVFVVNSFTGQNFSQIENAVCRLVDASNNNEVARYALSNQGPHTAMIMAKLYRHQGEWKMHAIGEIASGRTFQDLLPAIRPHL
jgi:tellurium resistance protein TerZ